MAGEKSPKSPREKKALSYERDCRNGYGENAKASRKAIPKRKAQESRRDRHTVAHDLAQIGRVPEEVAEVIESSARHDVNRVGGWRKVPDKPLGDHLAQKGKRPS
jgi:hypothetical protein